jgi:hypothetical protein
MIVEIINDGPLTIIIDSDDKWKNCLYFRQFLI